jgi:hypothetical protein
MDKLGKYRLDRAFTEGVEISLDDAPEVVFLVKLPSQYNRKYTQALYGAMDITVKDDGTVDTKNLMVTKYAQEDAFVNHCIVSMDGDPLPDSFQEDYPAAVAELVEKANELVSNIEEKVETSVKKSQPTSTGSGDGQEKKASTRNLSSAVG